MHKIQIILGPQKFSLLEKWHNRNRIYIYKKIIGYGSHCVFFNKTYCIFVRERWWGNFYQLDKSLNINMTMWKILVIVCVEWHLFIISFRSWAIPLFRKLEMAWQYVGIMDVSLYCRTSKNKNCFQKRNYLNRAIVLASDLNNICILGRYI